MNTDLELCTFYSAFFRESLKLDKPGSLRKFKKFLKHEQKGENGDGDATESNAFEVDFYREKFAYLFENNVFFSSAVAVLFKELLDKNSTLLNRLVERDVISICCFSDGTCAEIVAIVQVLFNASQNFASHFRLNLTVLCSARSWKSISLKVLKRLEKYQLLREHVKFININISDELPDEVHQVIRTADITTMVEFLSKIRNCRRNFSEVYKDIFRHLRPESIVFFLDCAYKNFFYGINRQLSSCLRLCHNLGYLHILNLETAKNSFKPFDDAFESYFFVKLQKICFGFWINMERSAYKRDFLNVHQVESVPLKAEKRFKTRIVTNNSVLHNSSKACSIKESTSAKNYKSKKSLESTFSNTQPLSMSEKNMHHKDNGIAFNKLKLESQKNKSNKIGVGPDNSSGFSEPPVVTSTLKRKGNEERRNQPILDKTVAGIVEQKQLDIIGQGTLEDREDDWNSVSCHAVTSESLKFPKLHWDESEESLKSREKSIIFPENNRFPLSERDVVDYNWDTDANKIEWAECEFNIDEELHDDSLPQTGTFCEKKEEILNPGTEFGLKKKKRKRKKLSTLAETVSNVAEQKLQNSPNWVFWENTGNNRGPKNFPSTTLKLQNIENDKSEGSLKRQEESEFLPDDIRFPQTQRNIGDNTCHRDANKIEWPECEVADFNIEKDLHDIPIPKTEALLGKNGKVLSHQVEFNSQKKKRKKEKSKKKPSPDETFSNVSEQKQEETAELVTQQDGQNNEDCKSCYPNPLKHSKLQRMDKNAKSLNTQEISAIFPENIQYFQKQRSTDDNTWDTVANEKEGAGKYAAIPNTDENLHDVLVPKIEGLWEKKEKSSTHFFRNIDNITWDRVANERKCTRPDTTIHNTDRKLHDVSTLRIEALCEKKEKILTHQLEFDLQKKKGKKETSKRQPVLDDTVFSNADQKRKDTSKLIMQQEVRNTEDGKRCNSTALEASKLQNIDKVGNKEQLKSQEKSLFSPENIQFLKTRRNMGDNTWNTAVSEIKRYGHEVIGHNNNEKLHNASISKTEALCEKNKSILSDQVEFDRLISSDEHCRFTGKCELFSEVSNNKKSPGKSDNKQQVEKFETIEKQNSYSNLTRKLINSEAYSRQKVTASSSMSKPWSQNVLAAKLDSLNQDTKQLSFTNCSNQKLRINEAGSRKTTTAATSTTKSHFLPQKVDTKQVKKFKTDSKLPSIINCLNQKFTDKEICNRQSVPSSGYETKPHGPSQNKQPSEEKVASKSLKNRKKAKKNKENVVSSKRSTKSSIDFFVPGNQIAGTVYTEKEKNIVQAAAMSSEKSFNSFVAGCAASRTITSKEFDEKKIVSLTSKSTKSSKCGFSHREQTQTDTQKGVNGAVSKEFDEKKIISLTSKSTKSSKCGFSYKEQTQTDTQKGVNGAVGKEFDEKEIISLTSKSTKSSKCGFSHREQTQTDTLKGVNGAVSKKFSKRSSCVMSLNSFLAERHQYLNEKDSFVESSLKKLPISEDKEEKNRKSTASSLKFETLPQLSQKKKKKGKGKGKKKKKAKEQTALPSKGKSENEEVLPYPGNFKFEFINEYFSVTTLAADYANTLLTKVNLIMREDIVDHRAFLKTVKVHQKRLYGTTDRKFYFRHGDFWYGIDSFVPAFNQSSPKKQRWNFWWRKWNWV